MKANSWNIIFRSYYYISKKIKNETIFIWIVVQKGFSNLIP